MQSASSRLINSNSFQYLPYLPDQILPFTAGLGSLQSLTDSLTGPEIRVDGNKLLIPSTIYGEYFAGVFELTSREKPKYLQILKTGGLAFSSTLQHSRYLPHRMFIFQDALMALRLITEGYYTLGTPPPITADYHLSLDQIAGWLPSRKIVIVLNDWDLQPWRHLVGYNVRMAPKDAGVGKPVADALTAYIKDSVPLSRRQRIPIGVTLRTRIITEEGRWIVVPGGAVVLSVDVWFEHYYNTPVGKVYVGKIRHGSDGTKVPFQYLERDDFFTTLKMYCDRARIPLYATKSVKRNLFELVVARSGKIRNKSINVVNRHKERTLVLPTLIITPEGILRQPVEPFPMVPAGDLLGSPIKHDFPKWLYRAERNQLVLLATVALHIAMAVRLHNSAVSTVLLGDYSPLAEEFLSRLSIPLMEPPHKSTSWWPVFYRQFPRTDYFKFCDRGSIIAFGEPLDAYVAASQNPCLVAYLTDEYVPLFHRAFLQDNLVAWLQHFVANFVPQRSSALIDRILTEFVQFFDLPITTAGEIAARIKSLQLKNGKRYLYGIVSHFLRIGKLDLKDSPSNTYYYADPKILNALLKEVGYPPIVPDNGLLIQLKKSALQASSRLSYIGSLAIT